MPVTTSCQGDLALIASAFPRDADVIAGFNPGEADRIALWASNLPDTLADSVDGLQIIRAGMGPPLS